MRQLPSHRETSPTQITIRVFRSARRRATQCQCNEAEEERARIGQWESERESYAERILAASGPELDLGRAEGRLLSLDEAVDDALSAVD